MHTTGIIVKECADEFALPSTLTRRVTDVRLFAPNLRHIYLTAPDYFFLTTDTAGLIRWFAGSGRFGFDARHLRIGLIRVRHTHTARFDPCAGCSCGCSGTSP